MVSPIPAPPIPAHAHLVWLGPRLSALGYLAVRAALDRGGFDCVTLHFDTPSLADTPLVADLVARDGFEAAPLDVRAFAERDRATPGGLGDATWDRLIELDGIGLPPAIRSDLHRLEILWLDGGVYLDTDAIVLRDFGPLRHVPAFTGMETICFPMKVKGGLNPLRWAQGGILTTLRAAFVVGTRHPSVPFQAVKTLYFQEPMGAVSGAVARHPLWRTLIERAASLPDDEARRPNRIGPWLFQEVIGTGARNDIYRHSPPTFYPFPPEISIDYIRPDPDGILGDTPHPDSYAAHLWDSVLKAKLGHAVGADDLRAVRADTLLGRMTEPYLDDLFRLS